MAKTKVLITVKTYPAISKKYEELVCTAGFLEDGSWISGELGTGYRVDVILVVYSHTVLCSTFPLP